MIDIKEYQQIWSISFFKPGSRIRVNEQLTEKLHKPVINKYKKRKVYARFNDNTWAADLAEMGSLFSSNRMLNIYYVSQIFLLNMHGFNL